MENINSILLKAFNKHFFEFLDDIIRVCPENSHLGVCRSYFETTKFANPTILIRIWYTFIWVPYHQHITDGDLTFFFDKDYTNDLKLLQNHEEIIKIINTSVRDPLKSMDDVNRQHFTKHFQLVSNLCAKYSENRKLLYPRDYL